MVKNDFLQFKQRLKNSITYFNCLFYVLNGANINMTIRKKDEQTLQRNALLKVEKWLLV